ncbi:MAG: phage tail tape measure protein [Desulfurellales bacterium]|nr:MAG: phage tail tape measure protein [Desulfurellales bacterium]
MFLEKLIVQLKYDTNRSELVKAKGDVEKLKAASRILEDEQRKSTKTTANLREEMQDLRVAVQRGLITQKEFKKRTAEARLAMNDETNAAKRTTAALKELKGAEREATKEAKEMARAQRDAAKASAQAAKSYDRAQDAAFGGRRGVAGRRSGGLMGGGDNPYNAKQTPSLGNRVLSGAGRMVRGQIAHNAIGGFLGGAALGAVSSVLSGIGDAFRTTTSTAIEFESAMADVAKVVDGLKTPTGETTAQYTKLADELKTLSTQIAVTPVGLAEMASAAGQAGIAGAELTRFVEDAAKTMVAFDISSEDAGNGLAKLRANLGIGQDEVMSLAGTMNHLSNNMASTAAEVLDATLRVGSVGKAAKISGEEVAGLTSAMIAAGATSEIAATATKNFILSMSAGEAATKRQRAAFAALGLNANDVAKEFTGSVEQRLAISRKLIEGLGNLSADKRAATTMQLFGRESLGPIASLTTNIESYNKAMALAGDTTAAAASVQKEYDVRSNTTANALQLLQNRISVIALEIGEGMMPAIREVIAEMGEFLGSAKSAGKGIGETLGDGIRRAWAALKDLLGPAEELPGKMKSIVDTAANMASVLMTVAEAVIKIVNVMGGAENVFSIYGNAMVSLLNPITMVSTALEVLVGLFGEVKKESNEYTEAIEAGFTRGGKHDASTGGMDDAQAFLANQGAYRAWKKAGARRSADDAAYERQNSGGIGGVAGRSAMLGEAGGHVAPGMYVPGSGGSKPKLMSPEQVKALKMQRHAQLAAKKRSGSIRQSEKKELKALTNELDLPDVTKGSGSRGNKAGTDKMDSAFEQDVEGEIVKLSSEAGRRAGIKAMAAGKSRKEQYAAAVAAEKETQTQLRQRVDSGQSLPGEFHRKMLDSAGFGDVAGRGQPPPIAVSIIDVKPMNVEVKFTGDINADMRVLRESFRQLWREEVPRALNEGIRAARMPVIV